MFSFQNFCLFVFVWICRICLFLFVCLCFHYAGPPWRIWPHPSRHHSCCEQGPEESAWAGAKANWVEWQRQAWIILRSGWRVVKLAVASVSQLCGPWSLACLLLFHSIIVYYYYQHYYWYTSHYCYCIKCCYNPSSSLFTIYGLLLTHCTDLHFHFVICD